jgi:NADPH2:quinone reductase
MREGLYPEMPTFPFTPGYDFAGIVDKGTAQFPAGQLVVAMTKIGGYAEYICVPEEYVVAVPAGVNPEQAVSVVLNYLTAFQMLHRVARVAQGDRVLIHGAAGGVGIPLLELGKLAGLEMYGTASRSKHALVEQLGCTPIDYHSEDFVKRIHDLTGDGVDVVFDAIGGKQWERSYQTLRGGGKLVGYSFHVVVSTGRVNMLKAAVNWLQMPRYSLLNMMPTNKAVMGYNVNTLRRQRPDWYRADLTTLLELLAARKINPVVGKRLPLAEASHAQELVGQNAVQGKLVLICNTD